MNKEDINDVWNFLKENTNLLDDTESINLIKKSDMSFIYRFINELMFWPNHCGKPMILIERIKCLKRDNDVCNCKNCYNDRHIVLRNLYICSIDGCVKVNCYDSED